MIFDYESNEAKLFDPKEDPSELNDVSNLFNEEKERLIIELENMKKKLMQTLCLLIQNIS